MPPVGESCWGFLFPHTAMSDLEWTDEPPEEPGWYWCRRVVDGVKGASFVQQVYELDGVLEVMEGKSYSDVDELTCRRWAGPIPEPDEPVEADDECQTCYGVGLVEEIVTDEHHSPVQDEDGLYRKKTTPCPECRSEERDTEPDSVIRGKPSAA